MTASPPKGDASPPQRFLRVLQTAAQKPKLQTPPAVAVADHLWLPGEQVGRRPLCIGPATVLRCPVRHPASGDASSAENDAA